MTKKKDNKEITTMALTITDSQRITRHCKSLSITKKEFIPIILDFIENNGINPKTDHAPKTELAQIKKRVDQYFGFIKTQEKEFLRPMLEAIQFTENRLQNQINKLVLKEDIQELSTKKFLADVLIETHNLMGKLFDNNERLIKKLSNRVEEISKEMETNRDNRTEFQEEVIERLDQLENRKWYDFLKLK